MATDRADHKYIHEVLSPRKRAEWKKRFGRLSRSQLKEIGFELVLAYQRKTAERETEIAEGHCDPTLVAQLIKAQGARRRLQTIYCFAERCENCPHGPYWYVFQSSKKKGETRVRYAGQPAFDEDTLEQMRKDAETATPIPYEIKLDPTVR
jgi:hypothetical protein